MHWRSQIASNPHFPHYRVAALQISDGHFINAQFDNG